MPFQFPTTSTVAQHAVNTEPDQVRLPPVTTLLAVSNDGERNHSISTPALQWTWSHEPYNRQNGFVDLTADSSPPRSSPFRDSYFSDSDFLSLLPADSATSQETTTTTTNSMPRQPSTTAQGGGRKRRRLNSGSSQGRRASFRQDSPRTQQSTAFISIDSPSSDEPDEVLDLTEVDDPQALKKMQEQQRERRQALQEQRDKLLHESVQAQAPENKGPFRLGQVQCVICMDNMTDMTATHCGRL